MSHCIETLQDWIAQLDNFLAPGLRFASQSLPQVQTNFLLLNPWLKSRFNPGRIWTFYGVYPTNAKWNYLDIEGISFPPSSLMKWYDVIEGFKIKSKFRPSESSILDKLGLFLGNLPSIHRATKFTPSNLAVKGLTSCGSTIRHTPFLFDEVCPLGQQDFNRLGAWVVKVCGISWRTYLYTPICFNAPIYKLAEENVDF